jgi:symplekin
VLDGKDKDKAFARFLLDLPSIPSDLLDLLRDLCVDSSRLVIPCEDMCCCVKHAYILSTDRAHVGFATLRGYVAQRPSMRTDALNVLLELTTHSGSFSLHLFIGYCITFAQTNEQDWQLSIQ